MAPAVSIPRGAYTTAVSFRGKVALVEDAGLISTIWNAILRIWRSVNWNAVPTFLKRCLVAVAALVVQAQLLSTQKLVSYGLILIAIFPEIVIFFAIVLSAAVFLLLSVSMALIGATAFVILAILGFAAPGVRAGSLAASYQAVNYGAITPAGSTFAVMQSAGARGCLLASSYPSRASIQVSIIIAQLLRWVAAGAALCLFIEDLIRSFDSTGS